MLPRLGSLGRPSRSLWGRNAWVRSYCQVCPTAEYTPPAYDRPRYSLKRFNMQLSQSVFGRTPNLERTQIILRVMDHDGVKGDNVTFYLLFSAIRVHQTYDMIPAVFENMKENGVQADFDIYDTLSKIHEESQLELVADILKEIRDSGYEHKEPEPGYISGFFGPLSEEPDIEEQNKE